jgi:hypothetical protein
MDRKLLIDSIIESRKKLINEKKPLLIINNIQKKFIIARIISNKGIKYLYYVI